MLEDCKINSSETALPRTSGDWAAIDDLFQVAIDRGLLSGAVVQAWKGGMIHHAAAIGCSDVASGQPMQMDSIFRLYSMTKPVMAAAMMMLWDENKWRPSDPIAAHLPELSALKVLTMSEGGGEAMLATPSVSPTLEHLMTHQAGFSYGFTDDAVDSAFRAAGVPVIPCAITAEEYLSRLAQVPLAFEPGTGWRYSVSMDVQGIIVERLSGMSLRDFMIERIFAPLGMVDTDFLVTAEKRERLATLYGLDNDRLVELKQDSSSLGYENMAGLVPRDLVPSYDRVPQLASGGGGLVSTASDYMRFGRMLLGRGELDGVRLLSPEAVALMTNSHTPHLLTGEFGTAPHDLRPGYEYAYNGITITDPEAAGVALGKGTYFWDGAAGCWFWVDPTNDLVFVALIQLMTDANRLMLQFRSRDLVAQVISGGRATDMPHANAENVQ